MSLRASYWPIWLAEKKSLPPAQIALENMRRLEGILEEQFRKKLAWLIYKACLAGPLNYIPEQL